MFEAKPAGCRAVSIVGHATVDTPVVPVPLEVPGVSWSLMVEKLSLTLMLCLQGDGVVDVTPDGRFLGVHEVTGC